MRDLRTTNQNFTQISNQFCQRTAAPLTVPFKGAIGSGFGFWMRNHWGFSSSGWFQPVARYFRRQTNELTLPRWRNRRLKEENNYTFLPTIRLTHLSNTSTSFFDVDRRRFFQTVRMTYPANIELRNTSRNFSVERTNERILFANSNSFFVLRNNVPASATSLYQSLQTIFSTLVHSSRDLARSFITTINERLSFRQSGHTESGPLPTISLVAPFASRHSRDSSLIRTSKHFQDSSLITTRTHSTNEMLRTTQLNNRLNHLFVVGNSRVSIDDETDAAPRFATTVALDFVAPKKPDADRLDERIARFVSSPALTYPKRQEQMSQGIIAALRDLQGTQTQSKPTPTPAMPSIEQLTNQVKLQLERDLRIEKERRGL